MITMDSTVEVFVLFLSALCAMASAGVTYQCVPPEPSEFCGSNLPSLVCARVLPSGVTQRLAYTQDHYDIVMDESFKSRLCPAKPESIPVPKDKKAFCTQDACKTAEDCVDHLLLVTEPLRWCYSYCKECYDDDEECDFKYSEMEDQVVRDDSQCNRGLKIEETPLTRGELLKVWALTGLGIIVAILIVGLVSAAAIFAARKYLQVSEMRGPLEEVEVEVKSAETVQRLSLEMGVLRGKSVDLGRNSEEAEEVEDVEGGVGRMEEEEEEDIEYN